MILTNGQAAMHYSKHHLTASVIMWLHSHTRQLMTNMGLPCLPIGRFVKKTKPCQFSSVQLRRFVRAFTLIERLQLTLK